MLSRQQQGLFPPPEGDGFVIAAIEDRWDSIATIVERLGVLRIFERIAIEGFLLQRICRDGSIEQADDGIGDRHGGKLAAGEDVVADGDEFVTVGVYPLVHTFIMPANNQ